MASGELSAGIQQLLRDAVAAFKALTPAQKVAHMEAQRQSWVRGEMAMGYNGSGLSETEWREFMAQTQRACPMDHMIWTDAGGWALASVDESYPQAGNPNVEEPKHECSDGKLRTEAEREAWLNAIWGAVRDGAST